MKRQIACKKEAIERLKKAIEATQEADNKILSCAEDLDGIFICKEHDDEWDEFEENLENLEGLLVMMTSTVRRIPR